jgi:hypothetical protein
MSLTSFSVFKELYNLNLFYHLVLNNYGTICYVCTTKNEAPLLIVKSTEEILSFAKLFVAKIKRTLLQGVFGHYCKNWGEVSISL